MGNKVAVLHIGTHKSGTTSLQTMIARNLKYFSDQGLYYPAAGRGSDCGHHNLAWELNGDDRYDAASGSVADLVVELEQSVAPAVLLSSEDFEYLYRKPAKQAVLRQELEQLGYKVHVVAVLREPTEYVASLYVELLKHGLAQDLHDFVVQAVAAGGVLFGKWDFRLDFRQLVTGFVEVFGADSVHVLPYDPGDSPGSVLRASGRLLNLRLVPVDNWERFNERPRASERSGTSHSSTGGTAGDTGSATDRTELTVDERQLIEATFGTFEHMVARELAPQRS
jgi:hypothetical protein